jgi:pimeloyl-ACP methyl ester carboxylesterase
MVRQTAQVLERYRAAGGPVQEEVVEGSGHGPFLDAPDRFRALLFGFLDRT